MSVSATSAPPLALAPAPEPARPRLVLVGTAFAAVAVIMLFGGLLAVYIAERAHVLASGDHWLPEGVTIPLTPGNMALVTLVMSAVTMQWAVYAVGNDDRRNAYLALGLTMLLGVAYINEMGFYFTQIGLSVRDESGVGVLFYAITGSHLALTAAGLIFAGLMAFRTLGGQYSGRDREGVAAAALFWYVSIAVFAAIWYAIFITK